MVVFFSSASDQELLALVKNRNKAAFESLYRRHCSSAYRLALRIVSKPVIAEEVVQEAFLSVWSNADTFATGSVRSWIMSIVRNRSIDTTRKKRLPTQDLPQDNDLLAIVADSNPAQEVEAAIEADQLVREIALLPDTQQQVVRLAFYGQLTQQEIAETLELPLGTVKSRMRAGLKKLNHQLES